MTDKKIKNTKTVKRVWSIAVTFVLVAVITVCSVCAVSYANSTKAENDATPKYYNTLQNFSPENNKDGSDNIFLYQYKTDNTYADWQYLDYCRNRDYWYNNERLYKGNFPSLSDEQWNVIRQDKGYYPATWMLAISSKGYMHIKNTNNCLDNMITVPSVAYLFKADKDGYVNIRESEIKLYSKNIVQKGYKALLRITKNGENIYPQSGYMELDDNTKATYPELEFAVSSGDEIRFEMTSNIIPNKANEDSVWVIWNPYISLRENKDLYTETNDVYNGLTMYMNDYFKGQTSGNMTSTDEMTLAKENAKRSKYGVYTALDSVYSGGILPTEKESVWKYATAVSAPVGFENPTANCGINVTSVPNGTQVDWSSSYASGLKAVKVLIDGKYYTYMSSNLKKNIILPFDLTQKKCVLQLGGSKGFASEVVSINNGDCETVADKNNVNNITYLNSCVKTGSGVTSQLNLSESGFEGAYTVTYATNAVTSEENANKYRRSIVYNATPFEQMMFGFTAPQTGNYEVNAPVNADNDANVVYSIIKEDLNGSFILIDGPREYPNDKSGFVTLVTLKKGETVWLNGVAGKECKIDIGIPSVVLKEVTVDSLGNPAYKYRAVDYVESSAFNNQNYTSATLTDKLGSVWEFGTFENPIETINGTTNYDTLGYTKLTKGDNVSNIIEIMKPYEIMRGNVWYNSLAMVVNSSGVIGATNASGVVGTLHTILGTNREARGQYGLPYLSKGFMVAVGVQSGKDNKEHNMGIYMKFTAPHSGNITLNLSDFAQANTGTRVTVIKNDTVVSTYASIIPRGESIDLGYMNKGETAYICYGVASGRPYNYGGFPVATVSGIKRTVKINTGFAFSTKTTQYQINENSGYLTRINSTKIGKAFVNWRDSSSKSCNAGEEYIVKGNTILYFTERYYGDLNGDGNINANDLTLVRKGVLNENTLVNKVNDITSDSEFDLKDLVRMKKWLAGYCVPFGEE